MNPPDESTEVEFIEVRGSIDIGIEPDDGLVVLTLSPDDGTEDVQVALTPSQAREVGEALFTISYDVT